MPDLVPIPWQPNLYLTPSTLALLQAASKRLGRNILLSGLDAAWRSYARQAYLYDQYKHHGGPIASSPDAPGQRSHMRGAAFDAAFTDAATQAACRYVGLVRDAQEAWHWNDPKWASMPIIPTNTNTAGGGSTPIPSAARRDRDMPNFISDTTGVVWYGNYAIPNPQQWAILLRYDTSGRDGKPMDRINPVERSWVAAALAANGMHAQASAVIDLAGLAKTTAELVLKALPAGSDAQAIAKAVEAQLLDDFAATPRAVNDDAAKRLAG